MRRGLVAGLHAAPVLLLAAALLANAAWSKLPLLKAPSLLAEAHASLEHDKRNERLRGLLARIPKDAVVSAHYSLVPHLSHRRGIYMFPNPFEVKEWGVHGENTHDPGAVDYIVVQDAWGLGPATPKADEIAADYGFERIEGDGRVALYARPVPGRRASCGDWNGNGRIDEEDFRRIGEAVMRGRGCPLFVCDADGDGVAGKADVMRIARRLGDPAVTLACPRRP